MADSEIDLRDFLLLGVLSVLWGGSFFFVGVIGKELPPMTIVLARVAIAALLLLSLSGICQTKLPLTGRSWFPFLVMGLLNNVVPFSMITIGQQEISSGLASVLNATTPLFTLLVMVAFGEEQLSLRKIIGILIGLTGVMMLYTGTQNSMSGRASAVLLCLIGALSYGFAGLWARKRLVGVPPITSATCQLICSSVVMAAIASLTDHPWDLQMPTARAWLALFGLAALSTALAYIIFFAVLRRSGATNVMLVTLLIPITSIILGNVFLLEHITRSEITGAFIIASALIIIDGRMLAFCRNNLGVGN